MTASHSSLVMFAALLAMPALADNACVVGSSETRAVEQSGVVTALLPGTESGDRPAVSFACEGQAVSSIQLRLAPGGEGEITLLMAGDGNLAARLHADDGSSPEWAQLYSDRLRPSVARVGIRVQLPRDFAPNTRIEVQLELKSADGRILLARIPIRLQVVDDEPLFRDGFNVESEPVIGQFSMVL